MDAPAEPTRGNSQQPNEPRVPLGREPLLAPAADVLLRYNARLLDPTTAVRVPGQPPIRPTVYISDRLIVSGGASPDTFGALEEAAKRNGLEVVADQDSRHVRTAELARRSGLQDKRMLFSTTVRLVAAGAGPAVPPDAWLVLQTFRTLVGTGDAGHRQVALDHLMTATTGPDIGGVPYVTSHGVGGNPYVTSHGYASSQYGVPGWGGRAPVEWIGAPPYRRPDAEMSSRRPVVAVLDTGVGTHPWLPPEIVVPDASVMGVPIGIQDPDTDPERTGVIDDPYEGVLDPDSGHGTFIAGLIRQACPDAYIFAIRVMPSDGAVAESDLLDALKLLVIRQNMAQAADEAHGMIDVVSLSLGYYHEQPGDASFDPQLLQPLRALSECGVAVVASAGNDATARLMFPAAFTPYPGGQISAFDADHVPLVSVGALNPDRTIALFSNAGPWVSCHRPGAALVSTFPVTFNASEEAGYRVEVPGDGIRASVDPDNFLSGFGTWSGTSFAAPILAGQLAQCLVDGGCGPLDATDLASSVGRAWNAITEQLGVIRP